MALPEGSGSSWRCCRSSSLSSLSASASATSSFSSFTSRPGLGSGPRLAFVPSVFGPFLPVVRPSFLLAGCFAALFPAAATPRAGAEFGAGAPLLVPFW